MKKHFVILLPLLQNCYWIPRTFNSDLDRIENQVTIQNISGIYIVEKRTIDYVEGYENGEAYIALSVDGRLFYSNITERNIGVFSDTNNLIEGEGPWKLNNNKIFISIKRTNSSWELSKKENSDVFSPLYGDPDSCLFTRFIKPTKWKNSLSF
jgi:hypothetical protein